MSCSRTLQYAAGGAENSNQQPSELQALKLRVSPDRNITQNYFDGMSFLFVVITVITSDKV